jgi:hypothetical protein
MENKKEKEAKIILKRKGSRVVLKPIYSEVISNG